MATMIQDAPEIYHGTKALSKSGMDKLLQCPAKFKYWLDNPEEKESDVFLCGSLFHAMVLEPQNVDGRYAVQTLPGNTKDGKAQLAEIKAKGQKPVKADMWQQCELMAASAMSHPLLAKATKAQDWKTEVSIYWDEDGVPCKARIDALATIPGFGLCAIDLKSTSDASPSAIEKSLFNFNYHRQAAWYRRALTKVGLESPVFALVFVEKDAPHVCTVATVAEAAQGDALEDIKAALTTYRECTESGQWPAYTNSVIEIDLPAWAVRRQNNV